ncbi:hypothetical protein MMC25_004115 [Agyrium rufum]|nr:hypothetical protein [Agyrium rufum]
MPPMQSSSEPSLDWNYHALQPLDLASASAKLRSGEASHTFSSGELGLVTRFDTIQYASNSPIEDYMAFATVDVGEGKQWHFWAVYDGHVGKYTADVLSHSSIAYVARALKAANLEDETSVHGAFTSSFLAMDNDILNDGLAAMEGAETHAEAQARLAPASSGSCALVVAYDPSQSLLHVSNLGDCRAVLGRKATEEEAEEAGETEDFLTIPLSIDQTASNPVEQERVKAKHPAQADDLIKRRGSDCERYVGIAVTRAFGDARFKWPLAKTEECEKWFAGLKPPSDVKEPPYLIATPETKSFAVEKGDFVILASDGLWGRLTSEGAVKLVGMWKNASKAGTIKNAIKLSDGDKEEEYAAQGEEKVIGAERISFEGDWKVPDKCFVVEDDNAATCAAKNALGGKMRQLLYGSLTVGPPTSRNVRDDITVQIIFFGDL